MNWLAQFDLFLFDFDGLLVNTEELHHAAYKTMCSARGIELSWSFGEFCKKAHYQSLGLKAGLQEEFPFLFEEEPNWDVLYNEKKQAYFALLNEGKVTLMPGAEKLLTALVERGLRRCVVTNSTKEQIQAICAQLPVLETIPLWITREDYHNPKPHPDGYNTALKALSALGDRIIGFEDTFKGLQALQATPSCYPVVISPYFKPDASISHFDSFLDIPSSWLS